MLKKVSKPEIKTKTLKVGFVMGAASTNGATIENIITIPETWKWDIYHDRDEKVPLLYIAAWDASVLPEDVVKFDLMGVNKNYFLFVREER